METDVVFGVWSLISCAAMSLGTTDLLHWCLQMSPTLLFHTFGPLPLPMLEGPNSVGKTLSSCVSVSTEGVQSGILPRHLQTVPQCGTHFLLPCPGSGHVLQAQKEYLLWEFPLYTCRYTQQFPMGIFFFFYWGEREPRINWLVQTPGQTDSGGGSLNKMFICPRCSQWLIGGSSESGDPKRDI